MFDTYEIEEPVSRPLKVFAFDPSGGRHSGNEMTVNVRYEELDPGPVVRETGGRRHDAIAVVDYDGATRTFYRPVNLDDPRILIRNGLDPVESNPQFHQQMVYAVATETIQHFEAALGRRIHWHRGERKESPKNVRSEDIHTLILYPHAFVGRNAFYSPRAHGILFGYFRAGTENIGRNVPGQTVFTCLSHDIIVHETTHAIVDGIRKYFSERTNPDVIAFHEAFADLAALFRHFTHGEVLRDTIDRTGGELNRYELEKGRPNPLVELAQQFGEATGKGRALRSALGSIPNSQDIMKVMEPHQRGSILVAAVFDAFFAIYQKRTADLWRIFRAGGGRDNPTDVPEALANRLCEETTRLAEQFFQICVRALDYCPPVDITFGTYLRAIVTADFDLRPSDEVGVRDALMQSFLRRGIYPEGAESFSERAVAWPQAKSLQLPPVKGLDFGDPNGLTRPQMAAVGAALRAYVEDPGTREKLRFDRDLPVQIPSFHPLFRINTDGSLRTDMVVEMVQTRQIPLLADTPEFGTMPLRGGVTLLIQKPRADEPEALRDEATIRYVISRHVRDSVDGESREDRQRRFAESLALAEGRGDERLQIDFAMVHGV